MNGPLSMDNLRVLDICREIELLNEELYRRFAANFSEDCELAALWRKTANEEANHALQFELAIRAKKEMIKGVEADAKAIATMYEYVRTILEMVEESPPDPAEALRLSIKLEQRLAGMHLDCIAIFSDESSKVLFRAMMANDHNHIESLLEASEKYQ